MVSSDMLSGVFAPIITPFDEDENVLIGRLKENIEKYNETGLKGFMPLGSNGEYQGLTDEESLKILTAVCRTRAKGRTIVAGCGRESAYKTVEFIKQTADCGMDMAFVLPPSYFKDKMTDEALKAYFIAVADRSPVPVVVYNAPKFASGLLVSVELIESLSSHPNIIAMKNSSMHPNAEYMKAIGRVPGFYLIAGNIKTFFPGLCDGAVGGVLSTASYLPEYCCKLYDYFAGGETEKAAELHAFLNALSAATIGPYGVAGVKLGMDIRGFYGGRTRLPLLPVPPDERKRIEKHLGEAGIPRFTDGRFPD
jgi:4-hydroxy-2-oxoglutarate aldolase